MEWPVRIQKVAEAECFALLRKVNYARLGCSRNGQPYVIPIFLSYSEAYLYGFSTVGQKIEWMRSNPRVCVEWDEATSPCKWTSVVVFGEYEELTDTFELAEAKQFAHDLLVRDHPGWWRPATIGEQLNETKGELTLVYFRIRIDSLSGRCANA
jgi:nitroimidazol reductase NimA-like FMN-containing flavoprotein (pyridoxamine 5'-phosphate oxidase superfamily)